MNAKELQENLNREHEFDARWIIAIRLVSLALALLIVSSISTFYQHVNWALVQTVYLALVMLFAFCAFSSYWMLRRPIGLPFMYMQFLVDTATITGLIYITGGTFSPFLFLYLPLVMGASILMSSTHSLVVGIICIVSYLGVVSGMLIGWFAPDGEVVMAVSPRRIGIQVTTLSMSIILISYVTILLRRNASRRTQLLVKSQAALLELTARQESVLAQLPTAVIVTDLDDRVIHLNERAKKFVDVGNRDEIIGKPVSKAFPCLKELVGKNTKNGGILVQEDGQGEERSYEWKKKELIDENGELKGHILILEDLTALRNTQQKLELWERMTTLLAVKDEPEGCSHPNLPEFVGECQPMQEVFELIQKVSKSHANILVTGESGTGKQLVAKAIHHGSAKSSGPLVTVNCGAVPENLIESELFGHKKGAFTSAHADHTGLFEQADGGTLFLDEIGELPLHTQSKLLRVIQEKLVRPVGGEREIPVDVRIIAATNKNLAEEVENGDFREDLFYRLNVVGIDLPPLRKRKDDIPLLVNAILKRICRSDTSPVVAPDAMEMLLSYPFPGNVRELENILERALVLGGDVILPEHLPSQLKEVKKKTEIIELEDHELPLALDQLLEATEKKYLVLALKQTNGSKKKAAELLGMNFRSFRYRLQKFDL